MTERIINIGSDGTVGFIYADQFLPLLREGKATITRASHVEPTDDARWEADLSPVGGPTLGPFETREEALQMEVLWLRGNDY